MSVVSIELDGSVKDLFSRSLVVAEGDIRAGPNTEKFFLNLESGKWEKKFSYNFLSYSAKSFLERLENEEGP